MKLQPHYFCPKAPKTRTKPRIRKGDVKTCYVRIKRRWVRIGTICLDCGEFVSELQQPLKNKPKETTKRR
ncbi:MAG: hypothetical protein WBH01_00590 [Dehalococcoidia bacterium]